LTLQCDEAWSFVGDKGNKQWIWLAIDQQSREIVGVHIGDRSREGAKTLERFNCTLRQRVSRLVRKTLSFSKKLENHIGAIWYFIHHDNASLHL